MWERVLREADIWLDYAVFETDRLHHVLYKPGHMVEKVIEMSRAYAQFLAKARNISDHDAVLVNREATLIGPALVERWVARQGKPLIYWLDDPLYIPYRSPTNGWLSYLKCFGKVKTLCRISAAVLANSPSHCAFARRYNTNIWEIPSLVDADVYGGWEPRSHTNGERVCVGWTGSPSTVGNLQLIRHPLKLLSQRDDVELLFIGAREFGLPDIAHAAREWRAEREVADLRQLDVGLLPVLQTRWTPHKFYLKLVQYMALGIPAVATPLGSNRSMIRHGENGFLASNERDWEVMTECLVEDAELRERMGRKAAETAHKRYTLQANAETIVAAFRSAVA